jgi:hypothetical protein
VVFPVFDVIGLMCRIYSSSSVGKSATSVQDNATLFFCEILYTSALFSTLDELELFDSTASQYSSILIKEQTRTTFNIELAISDSNMNP